MALATGDASERFGQHRRLAPCRSLQLGETRLHYLAAYSRTASILSVIPSPGPVGSDRNPSRTASSASPTRARRILRSASSAGEGSSWMTKFGIEAAAWIAPAVATGPPRWNGATPT